MLIDEALDLAKSLCNCSANCLLLILCPMMGVHDKAQVLKNRRTLEDKAMKLLGGMSMSMVVLRP